MSGHLGPGKCKQRVLQSPGFLRPVPKNQLDPHLHLNLGNVPHIPPFHSQSLHFASLSNCRLKALNNVDESKDEDVKFAFYYENNVLKRKWESKDGYKRGNQSISSWISSSGSEKSIRSTSSLKSWECTSHSTISFSISSFCLLLDLVTSYVLDFPKISIPNRASAAKFATNPTVRNPGGY
jgi:hypothetical protein